MDQLQIKKLIESGIFPDKGPKPILTETHISWVILTEKYAYKIKKPLQYSFLDFSTLEQRKYYCQREVELNKRLASQMYLKSIPVFINKGIFSLNDDEGDIIDYAVMMNKMNTSKEMDTMLVRDCVSELAIKKLSKQVAVFHQGASVVKNKFDIND